MSLLDAGMSLLTAGLKAAFGRTVTYTRGAASATVTPWVGRTLFAREPQEPGGAAVVWGDRDYLLPVADLATAGFALPARGDRITEVVNGVTAVFEVIQPDTGEPEWRYSDQTRQVYRLHTKRVN